jgi:hypothetical protein
MLLSYILVNVWMLDLPVSLAWACSSLTKCTVISLRCDFRWNILHWSTRFIVSISCGCGILNTSYSATYHDQIWLLWESDIISICFVQDLNTLSSEPPFCFRIIDKGLSSLTWLVFYCQIVPSPWLVITEILEMLQKIQCEEATNTNFKFIVLIDEYEVFLVKQEMLACSQYLVLIAFFL